MSYLLRKCVLILISLNALLAGEITKIRYRVDRELPRNYFKVYFRCTEPFLYPERPLMVPTLQKLRIIRIQNHDNIEREENELVWEREGTWIAWSSLRVRLSAVGREGLRTPSPPLVHSAAVQTFPGKL